MIIGACGYWRVYGVGGFEILRFWVPPAVSLSNSSLAIKYFFGAFLCTHAGPLSGYLRLLFVSSPEYLTPVFGSPIPVFSLKVTLEGIKL